MHNSCESAKGISEQDHVVENPLARLRVVNCGSYERFSRYGVMSGHVESLTSQMPSIPSNQGNGNVFRY